DAGERERVSLLEEAERSAARLETLRQRLDDEERNLPRPGSAFPLASVALLVAAGLALMAGLLAGGTALVAGVVGAVFFGGLAVMIWLGHQRQANARRSRMQHLEGARAAYRTEHDRLTGLLGQLGLSQHEQVAPALAEARRRLEAASQARRSHA